MKTSLSCDIMTYSQAMFLLASTCNTLFCLSSASCWFLLWLILQFCSSKYRLAFNLVLPLKKQHFITTAVRSENLNDTFIPQHHTNSALSLLVHKQELSPWDLVYAFASLRSITVYTIIVIGLSNDKVRISQAAALFITCKTNHTAHAHKSAADLSV